MMIVVMINIIFFMTGGEEGAKVFFGREILCDCHDFKTRSKKTTLLNEMIW